MITKHKDEVANKKNYKKNAGVSFSPGKSPTKPGGSVGGGEGQRKKKEEERRKTVSFCPSSPSFFLSFLPSSFFLYFFSQTSHIPSLGAPIWEILSKETGPLFGANSCNCITTGRLPMILGS